MSVAVKINDRHVKALAKRAAKIAAVVEMATSSSSNPDVRREGGRFVEVLQEWLDEIKDLVNNDDANALDRVESFRARMRLAEKKIEQWQLPPVLLERLKAAEMPEHKGRKRKAA
jgi:CRISPR/Cas system CSM-associated protein Csm2 small subunit